ncbi:MAG: hypothetical protein ACK5LN_09300 [Propioniciclava sp.]
MRPTFIVWGAGREGRGFLADLFHRDADVVLVDSDAGLVAELSRRGSYTLHHHPGVGHPPQTSQVTGWLALHTESPATSTHVAAASAIFLCIYLESMAEAVETIVPGLKARFADGNRAPLDVVICANALNYGPTLRGLFIAALPEHMHDWFTDHVGIVETLVRRTCVTPGAELLAEDPLSVVTNAFPRLLVDTRAIKGHYEQFDCLEFSQDIRRDERLKIFTYNLLHATYAYLGNQRGYTYLTQCQDDPEISKVADAAYAESKAALTRCYDIPAAEMEAFEQTMWRYVVTPALHDRVDRAAYNPIRKLHKAERLVGSALLCLQADIEPRAIVEAIGAGLSYSNPEDPYACELQSVIRNHGLHAAWARCSKLDLSDPLQARLHASVLASFAPQR